MGHGLIPYHHSITTEAILTAVGPDGVAFAQLSLDDRDRWRNTLWFTANHNLCHSGGVPFWHSPLSRVLSRPPRWMVIPLPYEKYAGRSSVMNILRYQYGGHVMCA